MVYCNTGTGIRFAKFQKGIRQNDQTGTHRNRKGHDRRTVLLPGPWINAVGTAGEKAAADALLAELKEDVCTIDHALAFFDSPRAVQYFGEEKAKELAAVARKTKENGGQWCFCEACAAGAKLIENAESFAC